MCKDSTENDLSRDVTIHLNFPANESAREVTKVDLKFLTSRRIPAGIGESAVNLIQLTASPGRIEFIERHSFANMKNLEVLGISNNRIIIFTEDVFYNLNNLKLLYLDGNQIGNLEKQTFASLTRLKGLYLDNNKLSYLSQGLFDNNLDLEAIGLRGNRLKEIFVDFTRLPRISNLDLVENTCTQKSLFLYDENGLSINDIQENINKDCTRIHEKI